MGISHVQAKQIVDSLGLTPRESLYVRMVSMLETQYGNGWGHGLSTGGQGSNNWGAITVSCDSSAPKFVHSDSKFNEATGQVESYETCFRAYATPEEGAAHLAKVLLKNNVRSALAKGSIRGAVTAQYRNDYFMGISSAPTQAERDRENIQKYLDIVLKHKANIIAKTGEPDPFPAGGESSIAPLILVGALGVGAVVLMKKGRR